MYYETGAMSVVAQQKRVGKKTEFPSCESLMNDIIVCIIKYHSFNLCLIRIIKVVSGGGPALFDAKAALANCSCPSPPVSKRGKSARDDCIARIVGGGRVSKLED